MIVLNKIDVPDGAEMADLVASRFADRGLPVFRVSALTHEGLDALRYALAERVREHRESLPVQTATRIVLRPTAVDDAGYTVRRSADGFVVRGERPERWVRQTDFGNEEAVGYLAERLARLGVEGELARLGATPGVAVTVGAGSEAVVFEWEPRIDAEAARFGPRGTDARLHGRGRDTDRGADTP